MSETEELACPVPWCRARLNEWCIDRHGHHVFYGHTMRRIYARLKRRIAMSRWVEQWINTISIAGSLVAWFCNLMLGAYWWLLFWSLWLALLLWFRRILKRST